jgi:hypothetical protein
LCNVGVEGSIAPMRIASCLELVNGASITVVHPRASLRMHHALLVPATNINTSEPIVQPRFMVSGVHHATTQHVLQQQQPAGFLRGKLLS